MRQRSLWSGRAFRKWKAAAVPVCCAVLAACPPSSFQARAAREADGLKIVATIFPEYDWLREVMGELASEHELSLLLKGGVDLHSYQPSARDITNILTCDLFIYVGGESDAWVEDVLREADREIIAVNLLDALGEAAKEEVLLEGMQTREGKPDDKEDTAEEEEPEYDEHVWLSLRNAALFTQVIADRLSEADPTHTETYQEHAANYIGRLEALDMDYREVSETAASNTLLFADRFPFRYLADDYGLSCYAAFSGCSAETEASFQTMLFLIETVNSLDLKHVMVTEISDSRLARTVIGSTASGDQDILVLNSVQSVTGSEIEDGVTYLDLMEDNLRVLEKALN